MWNLLGRRSPDPADIVTERWETRFFWKNRARFREESTDDYEARFQGRELRLALKRRNLFAWVNDPLYRYRDFVLEAEIYFAPDAGYCSAGLLFRYVNESTYYYFLVSTRGYFRFDAVFNGNPIRLVDWTELPPSHLEQESHGSSATSSATEHEEEVANNHGAMSFNLRIVANGTRFTFCYDDMWIAEIDDETIDAGGIAFGAQNYGESESVEVALQRLLVDSRGIEVETNHYRWREEVPADPDARLRFARSLFVNDNPTAAIIQIRKATKGKKPDADSLFLLAECQVNLGLNDSALANIERALTLDPARVEAQHEKANLLYLVGRYLELRNYLRDDIEQSDSSTLWNLYGHANYSLGSWDQAVRAYAKASEIEPEMPLFHINTARACEHLDSPSEALEHYIAAGRLLIRQDGIDELAQIIPAIMALDPQSREGRVFEGTIAFQEGNLPEAEKLFKQLIEEGFEDSAVLYMLGVIRNRSGNRRDAEDLFRRATELEPEFPLYWFRLAESRYLLGEQPGDALERAQSLAPDDIWTLNLVGQVRLDEGRYAEAVEVLSRASRIAPEEIDIAVNYAEALFRKASIDEAVEVLKRREEPEAFNTLGNIYSRLGRTDEALRTYEQAYALAPENTVIAENLAAACIEADRIHRAEEVLGMLVDKAPSASVLNRVGNLAQIEGDFVRAEAAYREAFSYLSLPDVERPFSEDELARLSSDEELNIQVVEIESNLVGLYLLWFRYDRAQLVAERLKLHADPARMEALEQRIRAATQVRFTCASCGREWWASKKVDVPPVLRLQGEPPADSPAGECERCGKVYCVGCAVQHLAGNRFVCANCGGFLKLNNDQLKYLVLKAVEASQDKNPEV